MYNLGGYHSRRVNSRRRAINKRRVDIRRRVDTRRCTDDRRTEVCEQQEVGRGGQTPGGVWQQQNGGMQTTRGVRTVGGRRQVGTRRRAHTRRTEARGQQKACEHWRRTDTRKMEACKHQEAERISTRRRALTRKPETCRYQEASGRQDAWSDQEVDGDQETGCRAIWEVQMSFFSTTWNRVFAWACLILPQVQLGSSNEMWVAVTWLFESFPQDWFELQTYFSMSRVYLHGWWPATT